MSLLDHDPTSAIALAIDHIPQGVAVFDAGLRLVTSNQRYDSLLHLPSDLTCPGSALFDIALFMAERGDLGPGDAAQLAIERIKELTAAPTSVTQRRGNSGQALEFHSSRLPNGGLVISFSDVTARVRAEQQLAQVN